MVELPGLRRGTPKYGDFQAIRIAPRRGAPHENLPRCRAKVSPSIPVAYDSRPPIRADGGFQVVDMLSSSIVQQRLSTHRRSTARLVPPAQLVWLLFPPSPHNKLTPRRGLVSAPIGKPVWCDETVLPRAGSYQASMRRALVGGDSGERYYSPG